MNEKTITISAEEYQLLVRADAALEILTDMLFNSAVLYGDNLYFNNVDTIMRGFCRPRYDALLQVLKARKEKEVKE